MELINSYKSYKRHFMKKYKKIKEINKNIEKN